MPGLLPILQCGHMPHPQRVHWLAAARALPPDHIAFFIQLFHNATFASTRRTAKQQRLTWVCHLIVLHTTPCQFYPVDVHTPCAPTFRRHHTPVLVAQAQLRFHMSYMCLCFLRFALIRASTFSHFNSQPISVWNSKL